MEKVEVFAPRDLCLLRRK